MATSLRVMNSHVAHKPPCFALAMRRQSIVLPGRRLLWPWEFVYYRGDCLEVREFERALSLEVTYFFFFLTFTFWLRIFRGLDPVCPRRVHFCHRSERIY